MPEQLRCGRLTEEIIRAFFKVYNTLGYGFLEKVYENALVIELRKTGLAVEPQRPITVYYEGRPVGNYVADLIIEDAVILELKSVEELHQKHETQLINYLRATQIEVGLLMNFGPQPEFKRKVFANERKSLRL